MNDFEFASTIAYIVSLFEYTDQVTETNMCNEQSERFETK